MRLISGGGAVGDQKAWINAWIVVCIRRVMRCKLIDPPFVAGPCFHRSARKFSKGGTVFSIGADFVEIFPKEDGRGREPPSCSRPPTRYMIITVLILNGEAAGLIPRTLSTQNGL